MKHIFSMGGIVLSVLCALVAVVIFAAPAAAQETSPQMNRTITVTGTGAAFGEPDIAYFEAGIDVVSENIADATAQSSATIQAITDALIAAGVDTLDIRTAGFNIYREDRMPSMAASSSDPADSQVVAVYHVNNILSVTVRDVSRLGELLNLAITSGANMINTVQYSFSDPAVYEAQARETAMADARTRAEQLAQLAGVQLGEVVSVVEGGNVSLPMFSADFSARAVGGGGNIPVSGGSLAVNVSLQVVFAIAG